MSCAGAPQTLADVLEIEEDKPFDFASILKVVHGMQMKKLKQPDFADGPVRLIRIPQLPLKPTSGVTKGTVQHFVDVIMNAGDTFDRAGVQSLLMQEDYVSLPAPLCPKKAIAHKFLLSLNIIPTRGGKCDIVKHYVFEGFVPVQVAEEIVQGVGHQIDYGSNKKAGAKPFIYMMQRMGGFAGHYVTLEFMNKSAKQKMLESPEDIDAGYDWIDDKCPRSNSHNEQARWVDKQMNQPSSPIFGWTQARIMNGIRNLRDAAHHAEAQYDYPLCWSHFEPWFQKILLNHVPRLHSETMMWLGVAGAGKTQAQCILGFAMSRVNIWEDGVEDEKAPSIRIAADFDSFKYEPGHRHRATIFDDGDLDRQPPRKTKNFQDATKKYGISVERYTSAKFVMKEFRSSADNKVDLDSEPCIMIDNERHPVTFNYKGTPKKAFWNMIRPAFPKDCQDRDIEAVLRRATIVVNTHWWVYVRPAGRWEDQVPIERHELKTTTFITAESKDILGKWLKTGEGLSATKFNALVAEEQKLFRRLLGVTRARKPAAPVTAAAVDLSAPASSTLRVAPQNQAVPANNFAELRVAVKRELEDKFFNQNKTMMSERVVVDVEREAPAVKHRRVEDMSAADALEGSNILHWLHARLAEEVTRTVGAIVLNDSDSAAPGCVSDELDKLVEDYEAALAQNAVWEEFDEVPSQYKGFDEP